MLIIVVCKYIFKREAIAVLLQSEAKIFRIKRKGAQKFPIIIIKNQISKI